MRFQDWYDPEPSTAIYSLPARLGLQSIRAFWDLHSPYRKESVAQIFDGHVPVVRASNKDSIPFLPSGMERCNFQVLQFPGPEAARTLPAQHDPVPELTALASNKSLESYWRVS